MQKLWAKLLGLYLGIGQNYRVLDSPQLFLQEDTNFQHQLHDNFETDESFKEWYTFYPFGEKGQLDQCHSCRVQNTTKSVMLDDNVFVRDGHLVMRGQPEPEGIGWMFSNLQYSGAVLVSKDMYLYGNFTTIVELPTEDYWTAYWLWNGVGEIDVFESGFARHPAGESYQSNLHGYRRIVDGEEQVSPDYLESWPRAFYLDDEGQPGKSVTGKQLHRFSVLWTPLRLEYYLNGRRTHAIYRYYNKWGVPILPRSGRVTSWVMENLVFPVSPMRIIHSIAVEDDEDTNPQHAAEMIVHTSAAYTPKTYFDPATGKSVKIRD